MHKSDSAWARWSLSAGYARSDVGELILAGHDRRGRNTGAADWLLGSGRLMVACSFPATDELTAHVMTLWRRA